MISRRIASALKRQDWITVLIELVLVVAGVLIALQLDQINDNRKDRAEEIKFLTAVRDDIRRDIFDLEDIVRTLTAVMDYGRTAAVTLDHDDCLDNCWSELVAVFHASQWIDLRLNSATFDEIKRTGLPRDPDLKEELTRYYNLGEQRHMVMADMPRYREVVRSLIPIAVQEYLWANCFEITGRQQTFIGDCAAPVSNEEARAIINRLRSSEETRSSLTFWLSTVAVTRQTLPAQIADAETVIAALSAFIDGAR